jgi:hypothetical protein
MSSSPGGTKPGDRAPGLGGRPGIVFRVQAWPTASARNSATTKTAGQGISGDDRNVVEFPIGHSAQRRRRTSCPCGNHGAVPMRIMRPGTQQRRVIG